MNIDQDLAKFIQSQRLMVIATTNENAQPWVCNVYFSSDNDLNFYIISPASNNHSKHIAARPEVAFSVAWYDEHNLGNRKAVQGTGRMELIKGIPENIAALKIHHEKYPQWRDIITWDNIVKKVIESKVYKLTPSYIKFWNDELYGEEGTKEFKL